jgi:hypothetical protein
MRIPIRSESDAFGVAYGLALVGGLSLLVGAIVDAVAGVALFALIAMGWLVRQLMRERPTRLRDAAVNGHRAGAAHRTLVVANEGLTGDASLDHLQRRTGQDTVIEVLAPVLQSRTHFVTTDIDHETQAAQQRLRETLTWARRHGLAATGHVGDPIDPYAGLADELRRYDIDEVIIVNHRPDHANWVEQGMLERLRAELDVPVGLVVVDRERELAAVVR